MKYIILFFLLWISNIFAETAINTIKPTKVVVYKSTKKGDLTQHVFLPEGHQVGDKRTAVVCFHGGGWSKGSPMQFYTHAQTLAAKGAVVFCTEYRLTKSHKTTPIDAVQDAQSSIIWVRENATQWGVDPDKIVAMGGSAGGHLTACTALVENKNETSPVPNAMVLFNPVIDTTKKGYGMSRFPSGKHLDYSPCHLVKKGVPPTIVMHGTADEIVPYENAERFTKLMKKAGNDCTLITYPDAGHSFFNSKFYRPSLKDETTYESTVKEMIKFLTEKELLK